MAISIVITLCCLAFLAGFVDAIVGGGGLIQTPAALVLLSPYSVATVIGSMKIPSFTGTFFATIQYLKKVKLQWQFVIVMMLIAGVSAFAGSQLLTKIHNSFMKPVLLVVLIIVAIYSYTKKNFGQTKSKKLSVSKQWFFAVLISSVIGFYDGFIGPGAGSFFILAFITLTGIDFLYASAQAKLLNLATNGGSIILFVLKGTILWQIAVPMAFSNALGAMIGAKVAIKKGNNFIRIIFLIVVSATLLRFAYDVFKGR
ncbi:MAG: hypothetical protein C0459_07330 [Chitinophaga sp.]|jgi:uncharacterized protein|nr:hypothetical protein [Chitinophaga sp.]